MSQTFDRASGGKYQTARAVRPWLRSARRIMQVHDERVLEVGKAAIDQVATMLRRELVAVGDLALPLNVDVGPGGTGTRRTGAHLARSVPGAAGLPH